MSSTVTGQEDEDWPVVWTGTGRGVSGTVKGDCDWAEDDGSGEVVAWDWTVVVDVEASNPFIEGFVVVDSPLSGITGGAPSSCCCCWVSVSTILVLVVVVVCGSVSVGWLLCRLLPLLLLVDGPSITSRDRNISCVGGISGRGVVPGDCPGVGPFGD